MNTTDSRVQLRVCLASFRQYPRPALERLRAQQPHWFTKSGDLLLTCAQHRSRHRNIELVKERLVNALQKALVRPKTRRATRPTRASQRRRVKSKKERGAIKRNRGRVRHDD